VASTSLGAEGLPGVQDQRHLLVADDPDAFAWNAVRLLREPELRHELAAAARELAEREYDWRALGDRFEQVLQDAASG
jgi:glycosyltransferase involved in cell wall biosynthesis